MVHAIVHPLQEARERAPGAAPMKRLIYPESNVGPRIAARGRNSRDYGAEPREIADDAGWEELKVEVRALLDRGETLPAGLDRQALENLMGADHIEAEPEQVLRLWVSTHPPVLFGVPVPGGSEQG